MLFQYSYLLMDLGFLAVWIILFALRKDIRKAMLFTSIPLGVLGLFFNFLYVRDWWMPMTITGTIPGIEDFLYGFVIGGISAAIYEEVFKRTIKLKKEPKKVQKKTLLHFWEAIIISIIGFYLVYHLFNINTFYITTIILLLIIITIYIKRKDLIPHALGSGICLLVIALIIHSLTEIITPGWIEEFYYFNFLPKIIFLNLPLEDIIFYFLFGAAVGPLYEFWEEGRLIKAR